MLYKLILSIFLRIVDSSINDTVSDLFVNIYTEASVYAIVHLLRQRHMYNT